MKKEITDLLRIIAIAITCPLILWAAVWVMSQLVSATH